MARTGGEQIDSMTASAIVDLALRACELSLACGSSSADATATALTICEAYGLKADVDVTWTSIYISYHRFGAAEPITGFRTVRTRDTDYQQLAQLGLLEADIARNKLTVMQARARFDQIRDSASPYRWWVVAMASGVLGGSVAALLGGNAAEWLLSGIASLLLFCVQRLCQRAGLAALFVQAFAAAVPTMIALAIMVVRNATEHLYGISPSMIAASGMVWLLAGLGVATAARDAMDGNFLTSVARTFDAVLQTIGIVFGVVITLWIGVRAGVPGYITPIAGYAAPTPWQILSAGVCAASFAIVCHVGPRSVLFCGLLGSVGYAVFQVLLPVVEQVPAAAGRARSPWVRSGRRSRGAGECRWWPSSRPGSWPCCPAWRSTAGCMRSSPTSTRRTPSRRASC